MKLQNWFIEPLNTHTNKICASLVGGENAGTFKAEHGKYIQAWICSQAVRDRLMVDEVPLLLRFRVWRRKGDGVLTRWRGHRPFKPDVQKALAR